MYQLAAITVAAAFVADAADDDDDDDDDEDDDFFFSTISLILRLTFSLRGGGTDWKQNLLKASNSRSASSISPSSRSISLGVNTLSVKDIL